MLANPNHMAFYPTNLFHLFLPFNYAFKLHFAIVIVAAILTPPDPYSMTFLAAPLVLLFFGGILLCKLVPKRKSTFEMLDGPTS